MKSKAFGEHLEDGILELTLDTPGGDVNVFGRDAAAELLAALEPTRLAEVRAVVIRSKKPGSFVNGAGLLMANTARRPEDAGVSTAVIRRAYRTIRELPVPVIAAIQGNCYGCGVEFALHAAYRVAERSQDTHFYMTEIADYLFLPTFGSTQDLPRLIGLEQAVEFLLWGVRWTAEEAAVHHLVDASFDSNDFEQGLRKFVGEVLSGARKPAEVRANPNAAEVVSKTRARIDSLPPMYRVLYKAGLELLTRGAAATPRERREGYAAEIDACGRSLMNPMAKSALSTFFVRQLAKAVSSKGARSKIDRVEVVDHPRLFDDLVRRKVRNLTVTSERSSTLAPGSMRLVPYGGRAEPGDVSVALAPVRSPLAWTTDIVAYAPLHRFGTPFVEIASRPGSSGGPVAVDLFARAGYTAIASRPGLSFTIDYLAAAMFDPIRRFLMRGGNSETVARTFRDFGFVKSPAKLAHSLEIDIDLPEAEAERGTADAALLDAVLVSLLGAAARALAGGTLPHPAVADLIARDILDFPLAWGTLCRYLSGPRADELVGRSAAYADYIGGASLEQARKYVSDRKYFYR